MEFINLKNVLIIALLAAKEAGNAILKVYNSDFTVEHKKDRSPLTLADKRSHEIILKHLDNSPLNYFPTQPHSQSITQPIYKLPILSEEGRDIRYEERKNWQYFWLVDPLDGTKEFIKRKGEFTVNIALIHKDRPILGIVHVPVKDTFYFAAEGIGAYKLGNSKLVELLSEESGNSDKAELTSRIINNSIKLPFLRSTSRPLNQLTIIGSRSHGTEELEEFVREMEKKHGEVHFISAGSSLKFCLVAEGKADIYPRFGPTMEWDTAAGQCVVENAGGKVLSMEKKEPLTYNKESLLNPWFVVTKNATADLFGPLKE